MTTLSVSMSAPQDLERLYRHLAGGAMKSPGEVPHACLKQLQRTGVRRQRKLLRGFRNSTSR